MPPYAHVIKDQRALSVVEIRRESLKTNAEPRDKEIEAQKAHERALKRFGPNS